MRRPINRGARVVVKVGSSSLSAPEGGLDPDSVARIAGHVDRVWSMGHPTVLVTSGAVAAGLPAMGLDARPRDLPGLQVAAAVGQGRLVAQYTEVFARHGRLAGQVLLTRDVLARRSQYLHAREALDRMLGLGIVPIVNENDTVVVDELRFGDNDRLAAMVSHLVGAGMLILLGETGGLYSEDPAQSSEAGLLEAVHHADEVLDRLRGEWSAGRFGSGGAATKVLAARMAAWSGIPTVIAAATEPDVIVRSVTGQNVGTWVEPHDSGLSARKLWIAFGVPAEGEIHVDRGAARALIEGGKSLLAVGVTGVTGEFDRGAAVEVHADGALIAKGLVGLSTEEVEESRGQHSSVVGGVVIHRDDLVVLA